MDITPVHSRQMLTWGCRQVVRVVHKLVRGGMGVGGSVGGAGVVPHHLLHCIPHAQRWRLVVGDAELELLRLQ